MIKKTQGFKWERVQEKAFTFFKEKLSSAPLFELWNFEKTFDIEYDASGVGVDGVLMQEEYPSAYFSEKFIRCDIEL